MLNSFLLLVSAAAVVVSIVSFKLGEVIRNRLAPELFRSLLLWQLLFLGIRHAIAHLL